MPFAVLIREQYWLDKLKPFGERGYNVARKAEASQTGLHHTDEERAKQSAAQKGRKLSLETRAKISAAHKGKHNSPEARAKMSASHTGKPTGNKGIPRSVETRQKISASNKGKRAWNKDIPNSPEVRAHLSVVNSRSWIVIAPDGKESEITNLFRFCEEHDLDSTNMGRVADGKQSMHKGWKCKRG